MDYKLWNLTAIKQIPNNTKIPKFWSFNLMVKHIRNNKNKHISFLYKYKIQKATCDWATFTMSFIAYWSWLWTNCHNRHAKTNVEQSTWLIVKLFTYILRTRERKYDWSITLTSRPKFAWDVIILRIARRYSCNCSCA